MLILIARAQAYDEIAEKKRIVPKTEVRVSHHLSKLIQTIKEKNVFRMRY